MTDQEFKNLKESIELRMHEVDKLQKLHIAETGQRYVSPMYFDDKKSGKSFTATMLQKMLKTSGINTEFIRGLDENNKQI